MPLEVKVSVDKTNKVTEAPPTCTCLKKKTAEMGIDPGKIVEYLMKVDWVISAAFMLACLHPDVNLWVTERPLPVFAAMGLHLVLPPVLLIYGCIGEARCKCKVPDCFLYLALSLFTLAQGYLFGVFTCRFDAYNVLPVVVLGSYVTFGTKYFSSKSNFPNFAVSQLSIVLKILLYVIMLLLQCSFYALVFPSLKWADGNQFEDDTNSTALAVDECLVE